VTNPEGIVLALTALREPTDTAILAVGMKHFAAAGKYLMAVCLVAYVPHQLIVGGIHYVMERHGKLYYTQAGTKVPTMHAYTVNNELAQLITYLLQLSFTEFLQVGRGIYLTKQWACGYFFHQQNDTGVKKSYKNN
jgi:hypothetical protein